LNSITPDAAKFLAELFSEWCTKPVKLIFGGAEVLEKTLQSLTPAGDKGVESFWWQLRLDALRVLRLQDEFELAALDFCVTYEVSPPPWQDARCEYVHERVNAAALLEPVHDAVMAISLVAPADVSQDATDATVIPGFESIAAADVELSGEVLGDAADALDKLQAGLSDSNRLVISCARLIRVDFSAAGSILNWVAVRESEGRHVQFRDVPRLVAAFFNVIGINEHAQVVLRTS
jgi:ABC-type transporter Mla MlaB component